MTIEIRALTFDCVIGILDFERIQAQKVVVDATIDYAYSAGSFLDYAAVAAMIKTEMLSRKFGLLEEAIIHLSGALKVHFPLIKSLTLTISKPDILQDCGVCVTKKSIF